MPAAIGPMAGLPDRKSGVEGVTGVQTCALPIWGEEGRNGRRSIGEIIGVAEDPVNFAGDARRHRPDGRLARSEERRGGSDWSSDVCSSDLGGRGPEWPA